MKDGAFYRPWVCNHGDIGSWLQFEEISVQIVRPPRCVRLKSVSSVNSPDFTGSGITRNIVSLENPNRAPFFFAGQEDKLKECVNFLMTHLKEVKHLDAFGKIPSI